MTVASIILLTYFIFITAMLVGWRRSLRTREARLTTSLPRVSVVIPVRDDAHHIHALLESLKTQDHQPLEVIVVDDHSTDSLREEVARSAVPNVRIIRNSGAGKKQAITTGVAQARGEVIITTDADCVAPPSWLGEITRVFRDPKVSMAFGPVAVRQNGSFFSTLQAIEFASLVGSAAATAALGQPTMCNGANLAYRKDVFEYVKGYDGNLEVPSGDDEFLLRKVLSLNAGGVRFVGSGSAAVRTSSLPRMDLFIGQRLRWASKWKRNTSWFSRILAVYILCAQVAFAVTVIAMILTFSVTAAGLVCAKVALEGLFLYRVCRFLKVRWSNAAFLALQLIHPFYVVAVGVASLFVTVSWKGRKAGRISPQMR